MPDYIIKRIALNLIELADLLTDDHVEITVAEILENMSGRIISQDDADMIAAELSARDV